MKSNKGFTLIDLIIVMAFISIFAAVAIPAYQEHVDKLNQNAVIYTPQNSSNEPIVVQ